LSCPPVHVLLGQAQQACGGQRGGDRGKMRNNPQPGGKSSERVNPAHARRACSIGHTVPTSSAPAFPQAPSTPYSPAALQQLPAPPPGGQKPTGRPACHTPCPP
jgi:hypothetical protein